MTGNLNSHPKVVLQLFSTYYQTLLTDPGVPSAPTSVSWLDAISLPKLTEIQQQSLNAPCTEEEVASNISTLKPSKAPGPDDFTALYFRKFSGLFLDKTF